MDNEFLDMFKSNQTIHAKNGTFLMSFGIYTLLEQWRILITF